MRRKGGEEKWEVRRSGEVGGEEKWKVRRSRR